LSSCFIYPEVEDDERIAYADGITGVPFYLFDGK